MKKSNRLTAIDLFSGCGGLTQGLLDAGFDVLAAVEVDLKARETYALNHPRIPIAGNDIRNLEATELMSMLKIKSGELDLLAGCPPCQGFSNIRRKNKPLAAHDPRNDLIDDFLRLAIALMPKLIMMENVPGIIQYEKFQSLVRTLKQAGYSVIYKILDVSDFGVPQRRKRLILSANKNGEAIIATPSNYQVSVRETIGNLPLSGSSGDELHDLKAKHSSRINALIAAIPKNGGSRISLPLEMQLPCHQKMNGFSDVYGRMSWDDVAPTITGGCTNPSKGRFLHPEYNRAISLREASLLQGFPRNYKFNLNHGKQAISLMIGNALPPSFISKHALAMATSIKK